MIGFNTLYLMPHWTGRLHARGPVCTVDPGSGHTKGDLRDLTGRTGA